MSVIQQLREKYAKLTGTLVVIGLLGFIFMDVGKGGHSRDTTIGKVNGIKLDAMAYDAKIKQAENRRRQQNQGKTLNATQQARLRDQVWQQLVQEQVLKDMDAKLGITITEDEVNDYFTGSDPGPLVRQAFTNPQTGVFNPQEVSVQIQQIKNDPSQKEKWATFVQEIKNQHFRQKNTSLLTGGLYVPKFVIEDQINGMKTVANAKSVVIPYSSVSDKEANVTDKDINAYIKKHKDRFEVPKSSRSIKYVSFPVVPSSADSARVLKMLDTLKPKFAHTDNMERFVNHYSQNASIPSYFTKKRLQILPNVMTLMSASVNEVVGPFYDGSGNFELAKIMEKKSLPDSTSSRHILVFIKKSGQDVRSEEAAKARIDSAIAFVKGGIPFDSVAIRFSDDQNSIKDGNRGETFSIPQKARIDQLYGKEFGDFIFGGNIGQSKLLKVKTDNYTAYNYVQILAQGVQEPAVKLAFISRALNPSDNTDQNIYNQASSFAREIATSGDKDFETIASEKNLKPEVANGLDKNSFMIQGLGSSRDLIHWAYGDKTKLGDVSPVYRVNNNYIIAKLVSIQPKGLLRVNDQNRNQLRAMVIKDKKAKIIMKKYEQSPSSLSALAQKVNGTVNDIDSVRYGQNFIPNLGNEPRLTGYIFNPKFKLNTVSPAIPGNQGVYFVTVTKRMTGNLRPQMQPNIMKQRMNMRLQRFAGQAILQILVQNADVKDERSNIY